jgi:hypothetical protein
MFRSTFLFPCKCETQHALEPCSQSAPVQLRIGFSLLAIGIILQTLICCCCCAIVKFARGFSKGKTERPNNPVGGVLYDVSAKYGNYIPGGTALGYPAGQHGTATGVPAGGKPQGTGYGGNTSYNTGYGGNQQDGPAYGTGNTGNQYPAYGGNTGNTAAPPPGYPTAV